MHTPFPPFLRSRHTLTAALPVAPLAAAALFTAPAAAQCTPDYLAHLGGRPTAIAARAAGNLGFVAYPGELRIIDVSSPAAPALEGSLLLPATPDDLHIAGDFVYAACGEDGLFIIDATNPAAPTLTSPTASTRPALARSSPPPPTSATGPPSSASPRSPSISASTPSPHPEPPPTSASPAPAARSPPASPPHSPPRRGPPTAGP